MALDYKNKNDVAGKLTTESDKAVAGFWAGVLEDAKNCKAYTEFKQDFEELAEFMLGNAKDWRTYFVSLRQKNANASIEGDIFTQCNRVDEFTRTVLSEIHFRNPDRYVRVRSNLGEDYQIKKLHSVGLESILNWRAERSNLYQEQHQSFVDGLISGLSVQYVGLEEDPDTAQKLVCTEHVSVCDFLMDGNVKSYSAIPWMAKRCRLPKAEFVREYGDKMDKYFSEKSNPLEIIEYWEIFSKIGVFGGIRNANIDERIQNSLEKKFGKYVKIVILEKEYYKPAQERRDGYGIGGARLVSIGSWEVPFYESSEQSNDFPFVLESFGGRWNSVWPCSPLKSALPCLRSINRIISKIGSYIENIRSTLQVSPTITNEQLEEIKKKKTFSVIKGTLQDEAFKLVSVHPDVTPLLAALQVWEGMFDRLTGLEAMRYITSSQSRSSADAQARMSTASRAMEAYAAAAESAMNKAARKEAFAWRVSCEGKDVEPLLGKMMAMVWDAYVKPNRKQLANEFDINVRADAARLPNRSGDRQLRIAFAQKMQNLAGQMQDLEVLNKWLQIEWAELGQAPEEYMPIRPPQSIPPEMLQMMGGQAAPPAAEGMM